MRKSEDVQDEMRKAREAIAQVDEAEAKDLEALAAYFNDRQQKLEEQGAPADPASAMSDMIATVEAMRARHREVREMLGKQLMELEAEACLHSKSILTAGAVCPDCGTVF